MQLIDWLIIAGIFSIVFCIAAYTNRFTRSVSDFLSANRCAGRYLLTMAENMSGWSAVAFVAYFEQFYQAGFPAQWWQNMLLPAGMIIALSGFVSYRFRETRAMTMAQFFEIRYSRNFRVFAGILAWSSGILNYGIFPAVTARVLVHFCGLPQSMMLWGWEVSIFPLVMILLLTMAVCVTLAGGQIAIMVTDFLQAQLMFVIFIVVFFVLYFKFGWANIADTLKAAPAGQSMLNPFDQKEVPDFNFWFFFILAFGRLYQYMAWQGNQGFYSSARNPHEGRMSRVVSELRNNVTSLLMVFIPICAYVLFHNSAYSSQVHSIQSSLETISEPQTQIQMRVPLALTHILPPGLLGFFASVMIAASLAVDNSYLHSWGSIFIQDIILPFRKNPLTPSQHLKLLRIAIIGIAVFVFSFSMFFPIREYILIYWQITGAIFMGGAGSVIIGGLYWRRGTTAGAWSGLITGSVLAFTGIIVKTFWADIPYLKDFRPTCPISGIWISFLASLAAISAYIIGSFLSGSSVFDLEKMLHRGKYAIAGEHKQVNEKRNRLLVALGIGKEFTRWDKVIYIFTLAWSLFWFLTFLLGTFYSLNHKVSNDAWAGWWHFTVIISAVAGTITVIWFLLGGTKDLIQLFKDLKQANRNEMDNGRVDSKSMIEEQKQIEKKSILS